MTTPTDVGAPPRAVLVRLLAVVIAVYGIWLAIAGPRYGPDSHTYSKWADLLVSMQFNIPAYLREQSFVVPPVFYLLWTLVIATLKATLGASWAMGVLFLNWLSVGCGSYVTMQRIRTLTGSAAGMLLAVWLLLTAFELIVFAPFVLSDLMFWAISTAVLGAALLLVTADHTSTLRTLMAGTALTLIALAFRPAALPLLIVWLIAIAALSWRALLDRFGALLLGVVIAGAATAMVLHGSLLIHPERWPFGPPPPFLSLLSDEYRRGVLVYAPESDLIVASATTVAGAVRLTLQKLLYFLTPWLPHFSVAHTLLNLAFFLPAYGLSAVAIAYRDRLSLPQQRAVVLLTVHAIAVSAFHAIMQIEFDHRYRLPMLPTLIMLSAIGLEAARRPQMLASTGRTR